MEKIVLIQAGVTPRNKSEKVLPFRDCDLAEVTDPKVVDQYRHIVGTDTPSDKPKYDGPGLWFTLERTD